MRNWEEWKWERKEKKRYERVHINWEKPVMRVVLIESIEDHFITVETVAQIKKKHCMNRADGWKPSPMTMQVNLGAQHYWSHSLTSR